MVVDELSGNCLDVSGASTADGASASSVAVEVRSLLEHPQFVAEELHLVQLPARVLEGPVQNHHQPVVEGAEQHAVTAVLADQRPVLLPRPGDLAGVGWGSGTIQGCPDGSTWSAPSRRATPAWTTGM